MKIGYLMQEGVVDLREQPPTGPAVHVIQVIKELECLGHQVVLLVKLHDKIFWSEDLETFIPVPIYLSEYVPLRLFEKLVRRLQYELRLPYVNFFESLRFASACLKMLPNCDILYERFGWIGYGGWMAARWLKVPIVWELNGDHVRELESRGYVLRGAQKWLSFLLMRIVAKRVDHTVATGDGWRQKHILRWGVAPSKISVIENGSQIVDMLSKEELRSFQKIPENIENVNIVYLGAFEVWHGIKILLKAFSMAIKSLPHLRLYLIGDGPERNEIVQLIHINGLEDAVKLTGNLDLTEVILLMKNAEIGVSPYCGRAEYSGLKLLDYKSAGLATIASGENGRPDVIKHHQTGLIVMPCNEHVLRDAIVYLSENSFIRRKLGQQARLEAEQFHRWRHTAEKIEDVFIKVLAS